jgi:hypothetical protein
MDTLQPVELMSDNEVLATFGTAAAPDQRGFDEPTHTRVIAYELVRARSRLAHYRSLYTTFLEGGAPYMIENLDEDAGEGTVPAKLVFTDDEDHALAVEDQAADVVVWTEPLVLEALVQTRGILDYFTELLNELEPAVLDG